MENSGMSEISYSEFHTNAVSIKDLCKSFGNRDNGKDLVLNKFCMNVKKGSIYGLLGASGCGKTTVLSCIVGLSNWDSGQLLVFGREPGSAESGIPGKTLGYMPQELALYNQLSIMETMKFYGRLYGMSDSLVKNQWKELSGLLDLSKWGSKLIGDLSGGQKRRASLAVALIHSPQLLILDEPTVGLDPVLRENIWNYLHQISSGLGTTIIITTHYIEEARYSNMIGLMRQGRMLVQESPSELMKVYESDLLEQVVVKICRLEKVKAGNSFGTAEKFKSELEQSTRLTFKSSWKLKNKQIICVDELEGEFHELPSENYETQSSKPELEYPKFLHSIQKTFGFTWVIFLIFSRYPVFFLSILMMPAIQGTITLWAIGSKPIGLPLGIVNHEVGDWITTCESTQNISHIESKAISVCQLTSDMELKTLSCVYLNQLKRDNLVDLTPFNTEDEARGQVELGKSWGYIVIPANFSLSFSNLLLAKQYALNESIEGSRIPIYLDYSQYISRLFIIRNMYTSYFNFMKEITKSCFTDEKMVDFPLNFRKPIFGDNEDNYTTFVMPGVLLYTLFGIISAISALLMIQDRRQGTMSRAKVAGLSCSNVILSHLIVQGALTLAQLIVWNIALYFIFTIPFMGQVLLYAMICLLAGLSGSAMGIFLGLVVSTEVQVLYIGAFLSQLFLVYGSIIWPSEAIKEIWQTAGSILPTSLPTLSLRSVIVRGVGIEHPLVWPGMLASVFWTIGLVILSFIFYRKNT